MTTARERFEKWAKVLGDDSSLFDAWMAAELPQQERIAQLEAENKDLREFKADMEKAQRMVMDERCTLDEKHCTCVPHLKAKVRELEETVAAYKNLAKQQVSQQESLEEAIAEDMGKIKELEAELAALKAKGEECCEWSYKSDLWTLGCSGDQIDTDHDTMGTFCWNCGKKVKVVG